MVSCRSMASMTSRATRASCGGAGGPGGEPDLEERAHRGTMGEDQVAAAKAIERRCRFHRRRGSARSPAPRARNRNRSRRLTLDRGEFTPCLARSSVGGGRRVVGRTLWQCRPAEHPGPMGGRPFASGEGTPFILSTRFPEVEGPSPIRSPWLPDRADRAKGTASVRLVGAVAVAGGSRRVEAPSAPGR